MWLDSVFCATAKTCLQSVNCRNFQHFPNSHSARAVFILSNIKGTLFKIEYFWCKLVHDVRKQPCCFGILRVIISIHKHLATSTMTMQVAVEDHWVLSVELADLSFEIKDLWKQTLTRVLPLSVKVHAGQARPVIPTDYPVDVNHRNQIKHEVIP